MSKIDEIAETIRIRKIDRELETHGAEKSDYAGLTAAEKDILLLKIKNQRYYEQYRSVEQGPKPNRTQHLIDQEWQRDL